MSWRDLGALQSDRDRRIALGAPRLELALGIRRRKARIALRAETARGICSTICAAIALLQSRQSVRRASSARSAAIASQSGPVRGGQLLENLVRIGRHERRCDCAMRDEQRDAAEEGGGAPRAAAQADSLEVKSTHRTRSRSR